MSSPFAIGDELLAEELNDLKMVFEVVKYTTSSTWVKPPGLSRLYVRGVGGGASAGGTAATGGGQYATSSGGGAGGYFEKVFLESELGLSETVDIGSGGAATAAGANNGNDGGVTRFATGKAYVLTANGGIKGLAGVAVISANNVAGGAGGTASGGDINLTGGYGGPGMMTVANGIAAFGGASRLSGSIVTANTGASQAGLLYGGGSSGASAGPGSGALAGQAGAAGIVILWNCY